MKPCKLIFNVIQFLARNGEWKFIEIFCLILNILSLCTSGVYKFHLVLELLSEKRMFIRRPSKAKATFKSKRRIGKCRKRERADEDFILFTHLFLVKMQIPLFHFWCLSWDSLTCLAAASKLLNLLNLFQTGLLWCKLCWCCHVLFPLDYILNLLHVPGVHNCRSNGGRGLAIQK